MSSSRAFEEACVAVSCITNRTCSAKGGVGGNQNVGWSAGGPPPAADARRKRDDRKHGLSRREPRCNTERVFRSVSRSASPPRPRGILYGLLRRTLSPFGNPGLEAWIRSCVLLLGVSSEDAIASRGVAPGKEDIITPLPTCQPRRAPDTACASTRDRVLNGELLPSKPLRTCASTRPTRARHEWRGGARVGR